MTSNDDQDRQQRRQYDSDRRGEHTYPDEKGHEEDRPSQRERDALKSRLEQQSPAPASSDRDSHPR